MESKDAGGEGKKPAIPEDIFKYARELRRNQTDAEQLLWGLLRDRRFAGKKFRRQHPVGRYILDFYCHELKLAIELDGG
jgi:very-short-patch-repair endonuclease